MPFCWCKLPRSCCGAFGARRASLGLLALTTQCLNGLAIGTVVVCTHCFDSYCRLVDRSIWSAGLETLIVIAPAAILLLVDYHAIGKVEWRWAWQFWASRFLVLVSLGYLALCVAVLRGPWLVGQAGSSDRISIWTARLSSTTAGVPLLAFALALGLGTNLWCLSAAYLRALRTTQLPNSSKGRSRLEILIWLLCAFVTLVGLATITTFATGGAI
jgi:hypothetical protein